MTRPFICRRCREIGLPRLVWYKRRSVGPAGVAPVPQCASCGHRDVVVVDSQEARAILMPPPE